MKPTIAETCERIIALGFKPHPQDTRKFRVDLGDDEYAQVRLDVSLHDMRTCFVTEAMIHGKTGMSLADVQKMHDKLRTARMFMREAETLLGDLSWSFEEAKPELRGTR